MTKYTGGLVLRKCIRLTVEDGVKLKCLKESREQPNEGAVIRMLIREAAVA